MTSQSTEINQGQQASPTHRLRLELDARGTGAFDGFWWPHSRDLVGELPGLLTTLVPQLGPIHRVIYHTEEWATTPRKLDFAGRQVRLDGYRHMTGRTLEILGAGGAHLTLQVITPLAGSDLTAAEQRWDSEGGAGGGARVRTRARTVAH